MMTLRSKKGVTLVELLAVIVILGIIAAIAVPTIGGLLERTRQNAAEAEHTNILEAARLYAIAEDKTIFTLAEVIAADYISLGANVYQGGDDVDIVNADIEFTWDGSSVSISSPAGELKINGYTVREP